MTLQCAFCGCEPGDHDPRCPITLEDEIVSLRYDMDRTSASLEGKLKIAQEREVKMRTELTDAMNTLNEIQCALLNVARSTKTLERLGYMVEAAKDRACKALAEGK